MDQINILKRFFEAEIKGSIDNFCTENVYHCIFCSYESKNVIDTLLHLASAHNHLIVSIRNIPMIHMYLNHYKTCSPPIKTMNMNNHDYETIDHNHPEDIAIRNSLKDIRLNEAMKAHDMERTAIQKDLPCLFCSEMFSGTWHGYLQWLFNEHQFNPGRPSNLVYIPNMISLLMKQLENNVCISCGEQHENQRKLKSHMRKNNHMRIPSDEVFDKFYLINYLELDSPVVESDDENDFTKIESLEAAAADFNEIEINETVCLICDQTFPSPDEAIVHMRSIHKFSFDEIRAAFNGDFYNLVRFVNHARYMKSQNICFKCGKYIESEYSQHMAEHECKIPDDLSIIIGEDQLLIPFIESDPLLTSLEDVE